MFVEVVVLSVALAISCISCNNDGVNQVEKPTPNPNAYTNLVFAVMPSSLGTETLTEELLKEVPRSSFVAITPNNELDFELLNKVNPKWSLGWEIVANKVGDSYHILSKVANHQQQFQLTILDVTTLDVKADLTIEWPELFPGKKVKPTSFFSFDDKNIFLVYGGRKLAKIDMDNKQLGNFIDFGRKTRIRDIEMVGNKVFFTKTDPSYEIFTWGVESAGQLTSIPIKNFRVSRVKCVDQQHLLLEEYPSSKKQRYMLYDVIGNKPASKIVTFDEKIMDIATAMFDPQSRMLYFSGTTKDGASRKNNDTIYRVHLEEAGAGVEDAVQANCSPETFYVIPNVDNRDTTIGTPRFVIDHKSGRFICMNKKNEIGTVSTHLLTIIPTNPTSLPAEPIFQKEYKNIIKTAKLIVASN